MAKKKVVIEPPEVPYSKTYTNINNVDTAQVQSYSHQELPKLPELTLPELSELTPGPSPNPLLNSTITPPSSPLPSSEKEGFFKKLFSKKKSDSTLQELEKPLSAISGAPQENALILPSDLSPQDDAALSKIESQLAQLPQQSSPAAVSQPVLPKGKSKGKAKKGSARTFTNIDEKKQFDWTRPISDQDILIQDNSRYNADLAEFLATTHETIVQKTALSAPNTLMSAHEPVTAPASTTPLFPENLFTSDDDTGNRPVLPNATALRDPYAVPAISTHDVAGINPELAAAFKKANTMHQKIRTTLEKKLKAKPTGLSKQEVMQLLKSYDEHIEEKLDHKELELGARERKLSALAKLLRAKETKLKSTHTYLKKFEQSVKEKESLLNTIIARNVEGQLKKRLVKEKALLKKELLETTALTKKLEKELDTLAIDRKQLANRAQEEHETLESSYTEKMQTLNRERERMEREYDARKLKLEQDSAAFLEKERIKLNELQAVYEKKLAELETDRKAFLKEKDDALALLNRSAEVAQELESIKRIRNFVEHDKKKIDTKLAQNKELEAALKRSEAFLAKERQAVEDLAFSKYIATNLGQHDSSQVAGEVSYKLMPLYDIIKVARDALAQGNIEEAKRNYAKVKGMFERQALERSEKEAIYHAIRELYNDIQLAILDQKIAHM